MERHTHCKLSEISVISNSINISSTRFEWNFVWANLKIRQIPLFEFISMVCYNCIIRGIIMIKITRIELYTALWQHRNWKN